MSDNSENIIKILPYYRYLANPWDKVGNGYTGSVTPGSAMQPTINKNCFNYGLMFYRPDKEDEVHDDPWFEAWCFDSLGKPNKSKQWLVKPPRCKKVPTEILNPDYIEDDLRTTNYVGFYKTKEFPGTERGLKALNDWLDEIYTWYVNSGLDKVEVVW